VSDGAHRAGHDGSPADRPDISVVIPTYKRPNLLAGVVAALHNQTLSPARFEVIAVDNCSEDDTFETLITLAATVPFTMRVLQTDSNHGPAPARNLGWMAADAPIVVFLDDDCLPESDWLASGLAAMAADPTIGVMQGRVRTPSGIDLAAMGTWYHCQIIEAPTPYFEACNIFYRHAALVDGGGFDESIGWWGEDSALGWSVVEAGWGRSFSADAVVVHAVQARGWRWHFRNGLLEHNMVQLAGRFPGFRNEAFWRPWAYRRVDFGFVLAVVGLVVGLARYRPALLLAAPYLWWRRPRADQPDPWRLMAENIAVDAARSAAQIHGAVSHQVLVV
jgi:GT2 family glycosyltransferase